ncbi:MULTISPECIES: flagellar hook-basal body complex protein [unclassified Luteibacter]|uniref:flagellar hook-basal body complex protein n=1 Tax=Luteibacter sp. PvP019 TaxID=3156436 RepID=UPI003396754A
MFQALFNGLSGLFGFSKSLDQIGSNISNMNTPGYRGRSAFFESTGDGSGTQLSQQFTDLSEGDTQQTGTGTDVAIRGKGLFVLHDKEGNTFYSRAGHFRFDDTGTLIDDTTGYKVESLNSSGALSDFSIDGLTTLPPTPTTSITFSGNLAKTDTTKQVTGLQVYDAAGVLHTLTATFTNTNAATANSWSVSFKDDTGTVVGTGQLRFDTTGALTPGFSDVSLHLSYNGTAQTVAVSMGTAGTFSGVTQLSGTASSVGGKVVDGHGVLGISNSTFDDDGVLQITYSNGEQKQGPRIALATVSDEQRLDASRGALYTAPASLEVRLGKANDANFGSILGGSLELSNVDLTRELTQMIIVQRGYQASSRVLTVTDGMLRDLYSSTGGGGG